MTALVSNVQHLCNTTAEVDNPDYCNLCGVDKHTVSPAGAIHIIKLHFLLGNVLYGLSTHLSIIHHLPLIQPWISSS